MPRSILIFALCVPLAILLGVMLANPLDPETMLFVGLCFLLLLVPLLLQNHHTWLIVTANAFVNVFFLPGQPLLWLLTAAVSFSAAWITKTLNRQKMKFLAPASVTWPLMSLLAVVVITAHLTGGIGARALGSSVFGARRYFYLFGAVVGYFALTFKRIPEEKALKLTSLFFLSSITAVFSSFAYALGPAFYFLFLLFPTDWAIQQAAADESLLNSSVNRIAGLAPAAVAIINVLLLRYGMRGLMQLQYFWRPLVFVAMVVVGAFSGFRGLVIEVMLLLFFVFLFEGLYKTRYLFVVGVTMTLLLAVTLPFVDHLPLAMQRALSFLPVKVDPIARQDAETSLQWRLDMWSIVAMDIPKYLVLGKGYALDPTDLYITEEAVRRGFLPDYESFIASGDYHSGPLSVIISFGIFGVITFIACLIAMGRVLFKNYKYGDPSLGRINTFLIALFFKKLVFFLFFFGALHTDFWFFTSLAGLSISLNGGVRRKEDLLATEPEAETKEIELEEPVAAPQLA